MEELSCSSSDHHHCLEEGAPRPGRSICFNGCGRPQKVCICQFIPPEPISTTTQIVIIQHPQSFRHSKLSTIPPLTKSLLRSQVIPSRRLRLGHSPLLDSVYNNPNSKKALFLFPTLDPSYPAVNLQKWINLNSHDSGSGFVLVVFDGTWRHAKEMARASLPFLNKFATQVEVGSGVDVDVDGESMFESGLVLKKEPFKGCLSTMEAVAKALKVLEKDRGAEVEEKLLGVLKAMVGIQRSYLEKNGRFKDAKPRFKLKKKNQQQKICTETKTLMDDVSKEEEKFAC